MISLGSLEEGAGQLSQQFLQWASSVPVPFVLNNRLPLWCLQLNFLENPVILLVDLLHFLLKSDSLLFLPSTHAYQFFTRNNHPKFNQKKKKLFLLCLMVLILKHFKGIQGFYWNHGSVWRHNNSCYLTDASMQTKNLFPSEALERNNKHS